MMSYSKPRIIKKYRFYSTLPPTINKEEYDKKKLESFKESEKRDTTENEVWKKQRDVLIMNAHKLHHIKYSEISKWFDEHKVPLNRHYMGQIAPEIPKG